MTILNGMLAELGDIKTVRLTCGKCGVAASWPIVSFKNSPLQCQNCSQAWFLRGSADRQAMIDLMEGLSVLSKRKEDSDSVSIRFEMTVPT